jgi:hypothetical protein
MIVSWLQLFRLRTRSRKAGRGQAEPMLSKERKREAASGNRDEDLPSFPLCRSRRARLTRKVKKESEIVPTTEPTILLTGSLDIFSETDKTREIWVLLWARFTAVDSTPQIVLPEKKRRGTSKANRRIALRTVPLDQSQFPAPDAIGKVSRRSGDVSVYEISVKGSHPDHLKQPFLRRSCLTRVYVVQRICLLHPICTPYPNRNPDPRLSPAYSSR